MNIKSIMCVAALACAGALSAATYYSGKNLGTDGKPISGGMTEIFKWHNDADLTTVSNPQPVPSANDGNTYVLLTCGKPTKDITFPEGTFVEMGLADGSKLFDCGYNCNSVLWTIPNCKVYGLWYRPNWANGGNFTGNYQLFKTQNLIEIGSNNLADGITYGVGLAGTFVADDDVAITLVAGLTHVTRTGITQLRFSGDFSAYKGNIVARKIAAAADDFNYGYMFARFESTTSMGDVTAQRNDAVVLRHRSHLYIDPAVAQSAARGITFDLLASEHAALRANDNEDWTLSAPTYGTDGTVRKVGPGTVTLAGAFSVTNIVVAEGSLVIADGATFTGGTMITVMSGARLVCTRGTSVPNVTFVMEPGARFALADFIVPFDGTATEAIDCTGSSAEDFAIMTKPIDVRLSDYVPMPQNETNRFAVVTFNAALGVQAGDFADASPKHFGYLPATWFEVETEGGVSTVYLVAKPMITRIAPPDHNWRPIHAVFATDPKTTETTEGTTDVYVWSDHLAAHPGADYVHTNKGPATSWNGGDWSGITRKFMGDSLYISGSAIGMKSGRVEYNNLVIGSGSGFNSINGSPNLHVFDGTYELSGPLGLSGARENYGDVHLYELAADLSGTGKLTLGAVTNAFVGKVSGTSPAYKGDVEITNSKTASGPGDGTTIEVGNKFGLGGELDAFKPNALTLYKFSMVRPVESMTMDVMTRGIFIGGTAAENGAGFDVPEGVDLEVRQPIKMGDRKEDQTFNTTLFKTGAGALKLNGEIAFGFDGVNLVEGGNNVLEVREGFLKAADSREVGPARMQVIFAEGAGIEVGAGGGDDGVFAAAIAQDGPIAVRLDASDLTPDGKTIVTPVCTVPQGNADLTFAIAKPEGLSGYVGKLKKVALSGDDAGLVRYNVNWEFAGTVIIFR